MFLMDVTDSLCSRVNGKHKRHGLDSSHFQQHLLAERHSGIVSIRAMSARRDYELRRPGQEATSLPGRSC